MARQPGRLRHARLSTDARDDAFPPCPEKLGLYAVLPDAQWVGRMARAGVPTVQLRFKSDDAEAIAREVRAAVEAVRGTGALLFINDHWRAPSTRGPTAFISARKTSTR